MHLDYALAQRVAVSKDFFFVQIGAFDGRTADPIFGYATAYGWRGLLVEPQRRYFEELVQNYAGHEDRLSFRRAAVSDRAGQRTLYTIADRPGVPHSAGLLASFDRDVMLTHREFVPDLDDLIVSEPVECVEINALLASASTDHIDLLQVDVEGYDHVLIGALDLERFTPSIVHFEHVHLSRVQHETCVGKLVEHGYSVCLEEHDTLAHRGTCAPGHTSSAAVEGPTRMQAAHDAQLSAQHELHREEIAALLDRLGRSAVWAQRLAAEAEASHARRLEEQRASLSAQLGDAPARDEATD